MKKKLLFVAAMAMLLVGAVSCGKKESSLEKLIREINTEELPYDDGEFQITAVVLDGNDVKLTYYGNEEDVVNEVIDIVNGFETDLSGRDIIVDYILEDYLGGQLLDEVIASGKNMVFVFVDSDSDACGSLKVTNEELVEKNNEYHWAQTPGAVFEGDDEEEE